MTFSVFDTFRIGIGPSSSHTVGPMVAARQFAVHLYEKALLDKVTRVKIELFGSLGATGWGHGTGSAVLLGLEGAEPHSVDAPSVPQRVRQIRADRRLTLLADDGNYPQHCVEFDPEQDLIRHHHKHLDFHPNAMGFEAWNGDQMIAHEIWYSIGGGAVVQDDGSGSPEIIREPFKGPYYFRRADDLVAICDREQLRIWELMMANETALREESEVNAKLDEIWAVMCDCIATGCSTTGTLPGGLFVTRRAAGLYRKLISSVGSDDPLIALDEVSLWALAVNEENAAGGRMVTAPTNGAAGVIPAVLKFATMHIEGDERDQVRQFLLTAGAIGSIFKTTASISGAEVGCQGEVGTACAMAAAGLAHVMGGTSQQVVNAAEIGLEHHLGLTCDPVGGLVQIPCIERNAVAAVKAITAARLAINDDGYQFVSLDACIRTMMETGLDMQTKYKETAQGGLAVNIIEC